MAWWRSGVRFPSAPPCWPEALRPAGAAEVVPEDRVVLDVGARVGGVDHLAAPDVDADVVRGAAEEDQVARLQLRDGHGRDRLSLHLGRVREGDAARVPRVHGEAGAVEAVGT